MPIKTSHRSLARILTVAAGVGFSTSFGAPTALRAQAVVPPELATVEGNLANVFPFNCLGGPPSMRYQQVYLGTEIGDGSIQAIRFRQDGTLGAGFAQTTTENVTIRLSSTTTAHPFGTLGGLSPIFADNIGADVLTVYAGDLPLSSTTSPLVPRPFDVVVTLQSPFVFGAGGGANLLLDVTIPSCWISTWLDAASTVDDSVARAVAPDATSLVANFVDTTGLVTQFDLVALPILLFEDGFESGDTSAWSLTVP